MAESSYLEQMRDSFARTLTRVGTLIDDCINSFYSVNLGEVCTDYG